MRLQTYKLKAIITCILVLEFSTTASGMTAHVTSPHGVNMRSLYYIKSEVLTAIPYGETVEYHKTVIENGRKWANVEYDGMSGYVSMDYLQPDVFEKTETGEELDNPDLEFLGYWLITAYAPTGNACANGEYPTSGETIACNVLDFDTEVYIDGIGYRTVEDRGPTSLGNEWIDVYMIDDGACLEWGSQYRAVYLVKGEPDGEE